MAGRHAEAESRVHEWLKANPSDTAIRLYLGEAYLRRDNCGSAVGQYESVLSTQPDNVIALNNVSWCYQKMDDPRAVAVAERALQLKPDNPAILDTLGWTLVQKGDPKRGVELLKKAVALAPRSPDIRIHYVHGLVSSRDNYRARQELERMLLDFPQLRQDQKVARLSHSLGVPYQ